MQLNALVAFASAAACFAIALRVITRGGRATGSRWLAVAFAVHALALALFAACLFAESAVALLLRARLALVAQGLAAAAWGASSAALGRENADESLARQRFLWLGVGSSAALVVTGPAFLHVIEFHPALGLEPLLRFGIAGKAFLGAVLVAALGVLVNLEATLRAAIGATRWRLKFLLLGIGAFVGAEAYLAGSSILYANHELGRASLRGYASLVLAVFATIALVRSPRLAERVRVSQKAAYGSVALVAGGAYVLGVVLLAGVLDTLGAGEHLPLELLVVFFALLGLAALSLSEALRQRLRRFVVRNLGRPRYDYRKEWTGFAERTAAVTEEPVLAATVARIVAETVGVSAVSVWLCDGAGGDAALGGSTIVSATTVEGDAGVVAGAAEVCRLAHERQAIVDLDELHASAAMERFRAITEARFAIPLVAAGRLHGVLAIGPRIENVPYALEDLDLLGAIAAQSAAALSNLRLSERLARARELEAFQATSAFLVHDLKNVASILSLTVQNLPRIFDDPEFRDDALGVIRGSVEQLERICAGLASLARDPDLELVETDLNELVSRTLEGPLGAGIERALSPLPKLRADPRALEKVLVNLVLNAREATNGGGGIRVATERRAEGRVAFVVADAGGGMSPEFVEKELFRPFRTTKSRGMGIGLFQSKRIVEAHRGRIEVESRPGHGSTFRVVLPASNAT